jgi:hypothetical protein
MPKFKPCDRKDTIEASIKKLENPKNIFEREKKS